MKENELPEFLTEKLIKQYGQEVANKIIQGYQTKRNTTFRVNTLKATCEEIEQELTQNQIKYEKVCWYEDAYLVKNGEEKELQLLKAYEQGKIYMQSLSSMLPPLILQPKPGADILDMAAAPRWKNDPACSTFAK